HRDLGAMMERGQFRGDLYARLSGFGLRLPPLRGRREDLGLLIQALLPRVAPGAEGLTFSSEAAWALFHHAWPLNVRELEKALAVAAVLAKGGRVELAHLPESLRSAAARPAPPPTAEPEPLPVAEEARRAQLIALLREHRGNISAVARQLGLARMQIQRWLKRYQLDPESFRS
ncbi:MAG TPA: helix-turn-helix domain-containing protein, partial [Myxococcaceae bacterium]|nr:helix-turn-helix domain-containing protein [Myxococcaceae bacterium]